jgi:glycogen debranching enzyme
MCDWLQLMEDSRTSDSSMISHLERFQHQAQLAYESFQKRFWNSDRNCLFDVVDSPGDEHERPGNLVDDPAIRPNQIIAIALRYPALAEERWKPVLDVAKTELLTPVGLRSLSPRDENYKAKYDGDLWTRDAAYHQGTVWAWLIGPFINAWHRTYPNDVDSIRSFLSAFERHLYEDGVGTISEIFDAEPPFTPRGCMAQAWSVAEVLRCLSFVDLVQSDSAC